MARAAGQTSRSMPGERQHQQQQEQRYYTAVQPAGKPRKIDGKTERFEPFPEYDVLLSSPHRNYLTTANHMYISLNPRRSTTLNVEAEVREPLHRSLKTLFWKGVPVPTFWVGADKVQITELWKVILGTERTFAIGKNRDKCYTVFQASDAYIIYENKNNGKGIKRKDETDHPAGSPPLSIASGSMNTLNPQDLESAVIAGSSMQMSISGMTEPQNAAGQHQQPEAALPPLGMNVLGAPSFDTRDMEEAVAAAMSSMSEAAIAAAMSTLSMTVSTSAHSHLRDASIGTWGDELNPRGISTLSRMSVSEQPRLATDQALSNLQYQVLQATEVLSFDDSNLGDDEATEIANAMLRRKAAIDMLHLAKNKIGSAGAVELAKVLLVKPSALYGLDLYGNSIGIQGTQALAHALERKGTKLEGLDLGCNSIGEKGIMAIATALLCNTKLKNLRLSDNKVGNEGAVAMALVVKTNSRLQLLYLSNNNISDRGVFAVANALKNNEGLRQLSLRGNNIGDEGAKALAEALRHNKSLQGLVLGRNRIGDQGVEALARALGIVSGHGVVNTTLLDLDLSANENVGERGISLINEMKTLLDTRKAQMG